LVKIWRDGHTDKKSVTLSAYNGAVFNPSEYLIGGDCIKKPIIGQFRITVADPDALTARWGKRSLLIAGSLSGVLLYTVSFLFGWILDRGRIDVRGLSAWLASGAVFGLLVSSAFYLFITTAGGSSATAMFLDSPAFPVTVGVPWILGSQLLSYFVFVGLSSYRAQSNIDREWLGRAGGWLLVALIGWFAISLLTFGGLFLLLKSDYMTMLQEFVYRAIAPITAVSGFVTAILGKSNITGRLLGSEERAYLPKIANIALAIAAPVFLAALIFVLSIALDKLLLGQLLFEQFSMSTEDATANGMSQTWKTAWNEFLRPILLGLVCSAALGFAASYWVNINRFSMHSFYRNRLIRAFLGASGDRKQDPFTRFNPDDNMPMHEMWPGKASDWQPFHIINVTLNLLSGKRLAWQERKAAPFSVSPLHCGTPSVFEASATPGVGGERPCGAYRSAKEYGDKISVGTAMAISGAAVSPNIGYHSRPAMTLLMSMLNVRLGWWLGNPAIDRGEPYKDEGPRWAAVPLFQETFGMTTDERKYVYLSDGGHFENLGLYEMVRRRCRFILVVDAGCDPEFSFEDLGNAVRKTSIDLGVPIKFHGIEKLRKRSKDGASSGGSKQGTSTEEGPVYHAIGEIDYSCADGAIERGIILYVKPSYYGCEGITVTSYAEAHDDFPHESTVDQWFSESQFESYRV
jgi:hypothetical protein